MTEKDKMLAGEMYDPLDPELTGDRENVRIKLQQVNSLGQLNREKRDALFYEIVGKAGGNLNIIPPFYCDYGYNIHAGENVFMNFNCCILDVCAVNIGNNVMIAPYVQIYTATHPLEAKARNSGKEFSKPITIGNDVWIGGGAIICPGVTIGNGVVIGAGSVVTRDIPDNVFAAGNPAKVIRTIDN
jgi:maltose O-acetyltransferase